jgi:signal peptidase II
VALAAATAAGVIVADQIAKAVVRDHIARSDAVHLIPGVQLVNVRNSGVAFGLFSQGGWLLAVVAAVVLAAVMGFFVRHLDRRLVWLPTGLLVAGALGNLVDRAREGAVTDFIDVRWWPAFNLADVAITFGVIGLLWILEGPGRRRDA